MSANIRHIADQLCLDFDRIFADGEAIKQMQDLISALKKNEPIIDLLENHHGSFSTIFHPFHAGTVLDDGTELRNSSLPYSCLVFLERCAAIERLIDELPAIGKELDKTDRQTLLQLLEEFVDQFPTRDQVVSWRKMTPDYLNSS